MAGWLVQLDFRYVRNGDAARTTDFALVSGFCAPFPLGQFLRLPPLFILVFTRGGSSRNSDALACTEYRHPCPSLNKRKKEVPHRAPSHLK